MLQHYQQEFIEFALSNKAILFGNFKLKSERLSPYFFNSGEFKDGAAFAQLGKFYAAAIEANFKGQYDVLFGPAYKGIPLATAAAIGLYNHFNLTLPVCFNRKEAKDHGEGGTLIGSSLENKRILLIDDVITAGTTTREAVEIIKNAGGKLVGIVIALDRQERGMTSQQSAIQEVEAAFQLKVASIIKRDDLIDYLRHENQIEKLNELIRYREQYNALL